MANSRYFTGTIDLTTAVPEKIAKRNAQDKPKQTKHVDVSA